MRNLILAVVLATVAARPVAAATTHTQGEEAGYAVAAMAINLFYGPAKLMVAVGGLVAGGLVGLLTGGDARAAYAVWVPTAGGTYMLTPSHIEGKRPVMFFGDDYADRPSRNMHEDRSTAYDAIYMP